MTSHVLDESRKGKAALPFQEKERAMSEFNAEAGPALTARLDSADDCRHSPLSIFSATNLVDLPRSLLPAQGTRMSFTTIAFSSLFSSPTQR